MVVHAVVESGWLGVHEGAGALVYVGMIGFGWWLACAWVRVGWFACGACSRVACLVVHAGMAHAVWFGVQSDAHGDMSVGHMCGSAGSVLVRALRCCGALGALELRRRSAGGVFFQLLKAAATQEQIRAINKFRKDRQKQGALHKQSALRSHQQPRPRPRKTEGKRMANAGAKRKGRRNQPEKNSRRILGPTDSGSGLIRKSGSCVPSSSLHNARRAGHAGVGGGRRVDRALDAR